MNGTLRTEGSIGRVIESGLLVESWPVSVIPSDGGPTTGWARAKRSGNSVANLYVP